MADGSAFGLPTRICLWTHRTPRFYALETRNSERLKGAYASVQRENEELKRRLTESAGIRGKCARRSCRQRSARH
jgi:hypothetical protein